MQNTLAIEIMMVGVTSRNLNIICLSIALPPPP
jgi:hypothetical protein